jgi:hypothetical protein
MFIFGQTLFLLAFALEAWILLLLSRRGLYRDFPIFFAYISYIAMVTLIEAAVFARAQIYSRLYWYSEPAACLLRIWAVYESFMRVLGGFYLLRWFRVLLPATIAVVLIIAASWAYTHPAHNTSAMGAAIIGAAFTSQYVVFGMTLVFFGLAVLLRVQWRIHEYRIVFGFAISSLAIVLAAAVRSEFGTKLEFLSEMLPGMAYIVALGVWLSAVRHGLPPEAKIAGEPSLEHLVHELRRQLSVLRSILRKL